MKKDIIISLGLAVLAIFIMFRVFAIQEGTDPTDFVVNDSLITYINVPGCVLRDEAIVTASAEGILSGLVSEGSRVAKDTLVAVQYNEESEKLLRRARKAEKALYKAMTNGVEKEVLSTFDVKKSDKLIDNELARLTDAERTGDYSAAIECERRIDDLYRRKINSILDILPENSRFHRMKKKADNFDRRFINSGDALRAKKAGIISYSTDARSRKFLIKNAGKMTGKKILSGRDGVPDATNGKLLSPGKPAYKLITGFEQLIACVVPEAYIKNIKKGDVRELIVNDVSFNLTGTVADKYRDKKGTPIIVFSVERGLSEIAFFRYVDVDIAEQRTPLSGNKILKSALYDINAEGTEGLIKLVRYNYAEEHRVQISGSNDLYAIVSEAEDSDGSAGYNFEGNRILTVNDEYIVNPGRYGKGERVR